MIQKETLTDPILLAKKRLEELKFIKSLIQQYLKENIEARVEKSIAWEDEVLANNIEKLKILLKEVNKDRHPDKIDAYVRGEIEYATNVQNGAHNLAMKHLLRSMNTTTQLVEVNRYSYNYSVVNDMYWIKDGTIADQIEITSGTKSVDFYGQFCSDKIDHIKRIVLPGLLRDPSYVNVTNMLHDVCEKFDTINFLSSNIILHSIIESMVRTFCNQLYAKQNPDKTKVEVDGYTSKFMSLERLITEGRWANDYPISFIEALIMGKYIKDEALAHAMSLQEKIDNTKAEFEFTGKIIDEHLKSAQNSEEDLTEIIKEYLQKGTAQMTALIEIENLKINVSIKVLFQFLLRRYKENRNSVVHGNFSNFDKKWYCYVNFLAVIKIFDIIQSYDGIYP